VHVNLAHVINVATQSGGVYLTARFDFTCRFEGSESGSAPCEEQLVEMTGRGGSYRASSSVRGPVIAGVVAAAVLGGLAFAFRRRISRLVRPSAARDRQ
jgi:hypothetical protein